MLNNSLAPESPNVFSKDFINKQFKKGIRRGPESSKLVYLSNQMVAGFHRLAINGLDDESMQPMWINNKMLICNGEIYNHKELFSQINTTPTTNSDCEIILHLYCKYGIVQTLRMLDGVFAFSLYDAELKQLFIARDPYGVRPLYVWDEVKGPNNIFIFASELKVINPFLLALNNSGQQQQQQEITQFLPGHYMCVEHDPYFGLWMKKELIKYHEIGSFSCYCKPISMYENIAYYLKMAVIKRCLTTDRPIACLLSGGLDSSLITALVSEFYAIHCPTKQLETYSIGLADSEDLKYARIVADHLGTHHTEVILTEDDFFNAIPEVIGAIESYDTTSVRASIGNYLIGKYIAEHSSAKVIFNGDGADELCGGYLYMNNTPDAIEFDKETKRLITDIYLFDVLRSDKSISSNGLEPRTPFLDKTFVQYYLSLPADIRFHSGHSQCEKYLLRSAFSQMYHGDSSKPFLPAEILWRRKEAFSDGVSGYGRSLYVILQEKIATIDGIEAEYNVYKETSKNKDTHLLPKTLEQYYYRRTFDALYPNTDKIVPYFWMPKYTNTDDPSARTLNLY
jgi:asparagine synthase (glutamine-hydrolysing)